MDLKYKGAIGLVVALLELSLLPIMLSIGGKSIGVVPQLFFAFLIGSITSVIVCVVLSKISNLIQIFKSAKVLAIIVISGLFNDVISQLLLSIGTVNTNPIIAAVMFRSWVIMAAILIPVTLRQKVTKLQYLAILIGFAGIYLLASNGTILSINTIATPYIIVLLGSALCVVYPNLAMKQYNVDVFSAIAVFNIASLIFISGIAFVTHTNVIVPINLNTLFALLFLGIATYGIGTSLYYYALKAFGPLFVGNSILFVPFITILFSFLILQTPVYAYYIAAALLLSVGIMLQQKFSVAPEHIKHKGVLHSFPVFDITSAFLDNDNKIISHYLSDNNKAFAIKVSGNIKLTKAEKDIFKTHDCLVFTDKKAQRNIKKSRLEFIKATINAEKDDTILIGIGPATNLDFAFEKFMRSNKS